MLHNTIATVRIQFNIEESIFLVVVRQCAIALKSWVKSVNHVKLLIERYSVGFVSLLGDVTIADENIGASGCVVVDGGVVVILPLGGMFVTGRVAFYLGGFNSEAIWALPDDHFGAVHGGAIAEADKVVFLHGGHILNPVCGRLVSDINV